MVYLSPVVFVSSSRESPNCLSLLVLLHDGLILALALFAWEPGLGFCLLSSQGEAPTAALPWPATHVNGAGALEMSLPFLLVSGWFSGCLVVGCLWLRSLFQVAFGLTLVIVFL